ncbi:TetR/AcrR family transcriptional regulator [Catenulispora sp. NF23]|uniref:TetR/AcrR family transcriptional regulator n=1 Tax=Catenulispora pinistramenti TaxID=2705254 RepID=A0ABS5L4Y6_9ACTN|nr:TetR/AcrR family transcriptional regulator [Catenulispora pinistramenti]MBS2538798.1 TetR/AcrR family transcriptional regulator [Catenulispora pinistramenti]MBS2553415.1 TetR/AcrR family transcriptional regulator [Catenulispora pinistramenti]
MPKLVDHAQRRAEIVDALLRTAADRGLHAVTMQSVALEAGISVRLVQYYFDTKEQLLLAALTRLAARMGERIENRLRSAGDTATPAEIVEAVMLEAIPADAEGRAFHLVYTEYAVLSVTDAALASQPFMAEPDGMEVFLVRQLRAAQQAGDVDPEVDVRREAVALMAMSAGLGLSVLLGQRPADDAFETVRHHLKRLFQSITPDPAAPKSSSSS